MMGRGDVQKTESIRNFGGNVLRRHCDGMFAPTHSQCKFLPSLPYTTHSYVLKISTMFTHAYIFFVPTFYQCE